MLSILCATGLAVEPPAPGSAAPAAPTLMPVAPHYSAAPACENGCLFGSAPLDCGRAPLQSDHAFPGFIGPITNPILAKDPRSLTELRPLFVAHWIPPANALSDGDFQVYAAQIRVALSERLQFIAEKDGYAVLRPTSGAPRQDGWLNLAAGLKYVLVRDVENQFLVSAGFQYEPQTGEAAVFQSQGDGLMTVFGTVGKEFGCFWHFIGNMGYQFGFDNDQSNDLFYMSLHLDRQCFGWLYPLVEMNWFHYTRSGNWGIPAAVGGGDGLLNLGTSGIAGDNLLTLAMGLKAQWSRNLETGIAYERPITGDKGIFDNRLIAEIIIRY
jgi:hypothetical protein